MMANPEDTVVVLAAHGIPATDFPRFRVGLLMMMEFAGRAVERLGFLRTWRDALDKKIRRWPRTAENDPYKTAVDELAVKLSARLDLPVVVAHNEFCDPGIAEAIDRSIAEGAGKVIVLPTMLVRGNSHTEVEIHEAVVQAARRHPTIDIQYAWPFDQERVISLLKDHVEIRLERDSQLF